MFEATKRYVRSLEDSVWRDARYYMIDSVSAAIEKSDVYGLEPGTLRVELLTRPGYLGCEAINWLAQHGGIEGEYEMSTILMVEDERIMAAIRCMQLKWLHEQHVPEEEVAMD